MNMTNEIFTGATTIPVCGPDGHAYLAMGEGKRGWFRTFAEASAAGESVVQRVMRGPRRGSEWTVKGGW